VEIIGVLSYGLEKVSDVWSGHYGLLFFGFELLGKIPISSDDPLL